MLCGGHVVKCFSTALSPQRAPTAHCQVGSGSIQAYMGVRFTAMRARVLPYLTADWALGHGLQATGVLLQKQGAGVVPYSKQAAEV